MSVTTSARVNRHDLQAALPPGAGFASDGPADLADPAEKTLTPINCTDADLQAAIATASAGFIDYGAIEAGALTQLSQLVTNLGPALAQGAADIAQLQADIASYPGSSAQSDAVVRTMQALVRLIQNVTALAEGTNYLLQRLGIVLPSDTGPQA